ncbi:MAG: hypothetical protein ACTHYC_13450 [Sphingobacterium sp.]
MARFEELNDPDEGVVELLMSKLVSTEITGEGMGYGRECPAPRRE